jgi:hypothetical protein
MQNQRFQTLSPRQQPQPQAVPQQLQPQLKTQFGNPPQTSRTTVEEIYTQGAQKYPNKLAQSLQVSSDRPNTAQHNKNNPAHKVAIKNTLLFDPSTIQKPQNY